MAPIWAKLFLACFLIQLHVETTEATFQIKVIRAAIKLVLKKYGNGPIMEGVGGKEAVKVLQEIDKTLSYLGVGHWVKMEEFMNAAVRVGLHRNVGAVVYRIVDTLF